MTTEPTTLLEQIQASLAEAMVPAPEFALEDQSVPAQLYYTEQLAYHCMANLTAQLAGEVGNDDIEQSDLPRVLQAVSEAVGLLDGALALLGVLPDEAVLA